MDEVSKTLGSLQAQNEIILDGIKDIRAHLQKLNGKTDKAHDRMDDIEPILRDAVANGNDWKDTKGKIKFLAGIGILGGGVGGFSFTGLISKLFGAE